MNDLDDVTYGRTRRAGWLEDPLGRLNIVGALITRYRVRRLCDRSLQALRQVESEASNASVRARYALVIERLSGADSGVAATLLRRAEESFAQWPIERDLSFRDVVRYLAVTDCLKTDVAVDGVRSRQVDSVLAVVAELIPPEL